MACVVLGTALGAQPLMGHLLTDHALQTRGKTWTRPCGNLPHRPLHAWRAPSSRCSARPQGKVSASFPHAASGARGLSPFSR